MGFDSQGIGQCFQMLVAREQPAPEAVSPRGMGSTIADPAGSPACTDRDGGTFSCPPNCSLFKEVRGLGATLRRRYPTNLPQIAALLPVFRPVGSAKCGGGKRRLRPQRVKQTLQFSHPQRALPITPAILAPHPVSQESHPNKRVQTLSETCFHGLRALWERSAAQMTRFRAMYQLQGRHIPSLQNLLPCLFVSLDRRPHRGQPPRYRIGLPDFCVPRRVLLSVWRRRPPAWWRRLS